MAIKHVHGKDQGQVMLYALSTCIWCKKTRQLLDDLGVAYDYEYVDLLLGNEKTKAMDVVRKWNPSCSFPTLLINNKCIVGFQENEIRETLRG